MFYLHSVYIYWTITSPFSLCFFCISSLLNEHTKETDFYLTSQARTRTHIYIETLQSVGSNLSLMASKPFVPILLLLLHLILHVGYGAAFRIHDLSTNVKALENMKKYSQDMMSSSAVLEVHKLPRFERPRFGFLPKAAPIPPSGPSKRHNRHVKGDVRTGSGRKVRRDRKILSWFTEDLWKKNVLKLVENQRWK